MGDEPTRPWDFDLPVDFIDLPGVRWVLDEVAERLDVGGDVIVVEPQQPAPDWREGGPWK